MADKRAYASLVPYRLRGSEYEFFIQKRDAHTSLNPGLHGLFGGSIEPTETAEAAMVREIQEELSYTPTNYIHFFTYELKESILHVYVEAVDAHFEKNVRVQEGEYGTFMTLAELVERKDVSQISEFALVEISRFLTA